MMINKRFTSIFISLILMGSVLLLGTLPTFADSDYIVINGVTCAPVELTSEQIKAMFDNGDFTASYGLSASTEANISLFDMVNQTSSVVTLTSDRTLYTLTDCDINSVGNLVFSAPYSYNLRVNSSSTVQSYLYLSFPFNYYIYNYSPFFQFYYSGLSNDQTTTVGVQFVSDDIDLVTSVNSSRQVSYWSSHSGVKLWYNKYNWVPNGYTFDTSSTGIRSAFSRGNFYNLSSDSFFNELRIWESANFVHASGTGYDYFFCAPMVTVCSLAGTVYVPVTYEEQVVEYLGLITGSPTASDQQRINELKSEMNSNAQALSDAADDLHKDLPDLPDVTDLPEEVTDGVGEASEIVITPLMGIGVVNILVIVAISFSAIKLILYGSGPY